MSNFVPKELTLVKGLINEGKYEEAIQHIRDIEQKGNLNPEELLKTLRYKGSIYYSLRHLGKALKISEDLYQKSKEMKLPLFTLDALGIKGSVFIILGKYEDFFKTLEDGEKLFESIPREDSFEFKEREAYLIGFKGYRNFLVGKFNLALDLYYRSLALVQQLDPQNSSLRGWNLNIMAYAYQAKGELNLALECAEKALSIGPRGDYFLKGDLYRIMGSIYRQKGDFNRALDYHIQSLEIYKTFKEGWWIGWAYFSIILVLLGKKEINQAQNYLQQFKQFNDKYKIKFDYLIYMLAQALVLKSSTRVRDQVEAKTILKKIVKGNFTIFVTNIALINLCDWYFEEFRISNQMELLDDIQQLVDHLVKNARDQNSYTLLANVKLFKAKLALLQINMVEARKLLTEAQHIADDHDLQLLAGEISKEHDKLLEELKMWEKFKKTQASISERLRLASIDVVLDRMQGKRAIEAPELSEEEPILLLIMDESGITYFNHLFIENWDHSDLFSSFVSAFNTFSDEIFSKSIDRIRIGENTILINPIESFLTCYVIKGQSYPALQRLTRFTEAIKENSEIWQALNKSVKTSEMLELDKPPVLKTVIDEIFTH
ncbi:MAG: hypothetical protein ACFFFB_22125 [Candidatus Heimdallarchaeota archaeon]